MKKVFFAFVAASVVALSACNNKPATEEATASTVDTATAPVEAVVDTTAAPADTTAAPATK